jgi:hypothetical protein
MKEEGGPPPPLQVVTVRTDRVVTLTTTLRSAGPVQQVTMQAERNHKEAWRRLMNQPGVSLGAVVDTKGQGILLDALRRIALSKAPPGHLVGIAHEALLLIGDRSVAPLDDTDVQ